MVNSFMGCRIVPVSEYENRCLTHDCSQAECLWRQRDRLEAQLERYKLALDHATMCPLIQQARIVMGDSPERVTACDGCRDALLLLVPGDCAAVNPISGMSCQEPNGHDGPHIARGVSPRTSFVWGDEARISKEKE